MSRSCMTVLYVLCCKGLVILKTGYRVGGNLRGMKFSGEKLRGAKFFGKCLRGMKFH